MHRRTSRTVPAAAVPVPRRAAHRPAGPGNAATIRLLRRGGEDRDGADQHGGGAPDPVTLAGIDAERGRGAPLGPAARGDLESALDADLSPVRVHVGARADQLSRALDARAFTTGADIFFSAGSYAPDTAAGRELLAHEVVHTLQPATGPARVSDPGDREEVHARTLAADVAGRVAAGAGNQATVGLLRATAGGPAGHIGRQSHGHQPAHGHEPAHGGGGAGGHFARASTVRAYIALVREAERRLIAAGHSGPDERIRILSGVYYGTSWSVDHADQGSDVRDAGFQVYTGRSGPGTDPHSILGASLLRALQQSQDVGGIDMGHALIGLNARSSGAVPRGLPLPGHGATGLEVSTWVGDLGGAAGRLANDRVHDSRATAGRYFAGTDYGASSNIAGDLAGYLLAAGAGATTVQAPQWPESGLIADALAAYFTSRAAQSDGVWQFLTMQGAQFTGHRLSNRSEVEEAMAHKFATFGRLYLANYLRQRGTFDPERFLAAEGNLDAAGADVARLFLDRLLAALPATLPTATTPAPGALDRLLELIGL